MTTYLFANVTVTDPQQYEEYKRWSTQAMREHGAQVLVRGGETDVLEGDWVPDRVVILAFKDKASALAFYQSETYGKAKAARAGAAIMRMVLIEGA
ncbi:MAG: hypothetical protein RL357_1050 [Pseudomonadota bacterium]